MRYNCLGAKCSTNRGTHILALHQSLCNDAPWSLNDLEESNDVWMLNKFQDVDLSGYTSHIGHIDDSFLGQQHTLIACAATLDCFTKVKTFRVPLTTNAESPSPPDAVN
eukprot:1453447-Amphidinium_carterae.1